jgi:hypothetical protein
MGRCAQEGWEKKDLPEYVAYVARKSLLSFTTSLTKVSSQAHDFFAQINGYLAFERMMRNCFGWMMPSITPPMRMPMSTPVATTSMQQMWTTPDWFAFMPQALPKPRAAAFPINDDFPIYGALMAMSATFFSLAPATMQAWGLPV